MNYQQQAPQRARARVQMNTVRLTDPAQIAANQRGFLTPEQIGRLASKKHSTFGGCLLIILSGIFLCFIGGTSISLAVQGQFPVTSPGPSVAVLVLLVLIGLGWLLFQRALAARSRFQQDVATGVVQFSIESAQGEIVWDREKYVAHIPGHILAFISGSRAAGSLAPGPYHFYYVREWNMIVSAQSIHTHTQMLTLPGTLAETGLPGDEQARLAVQYALCSALDFTLVDLEANRQGYLTNEQMRKSPRKVVRKQMFTVQNIMGEIQLASNTSDDEYTLYYYDIGGLRFEVPSVRAHSALVKGIPYRAYYLVEAKNALLSVEPLEAPIR